MFTHPPDLKRRPKRLGVCGMCRRPFDKQTLPPTKDHIVPDGFFNDPPPNNLPTWLVCEGCQDELDPREERLRNLFASAHSHHPDQVANVHARAARSARAPVPVARKHVTTPAGLLVPASIAIARQDDLDAVFRKIVTGLLWYRDGELTADDRFIVRLMSSADHTLWISQLKDHCPVQRLGSEFWWMCGYDRKDPGWSVWLFLIHGAVPVGVWQGGAVESKGIPTPAGVVLREHAYR